MLILRKKIMYKAFSLSVLSEILLPELPSIDNIVDSVDIEIIFDDLSKQWSDLSDSQNEFVIKENLIMFQVSQIATFLIQDGKIIKVSPMKDYDEDVIRLYLLGTCMGAILMQKKILTLHGSAVVINNKGYAFIGDSGAGKSTLASKFLSKGYKLLSDDVIAITLSKENIPFVVPSFPHQKLWENSLQEFGMDPSDYRPIFERETKYSVPVSVSYKFFSKPIQLGGVFELIKSQTAETQINHILGLERLYLLYRHTFRNFLLRNSGMMDWHFKKTTSIVNQIDVYQLSRPINSGFSANNLADLVLSKFK